MPFTRSIEARRARPARLAALCLLVAPAPVSARAPITPVPFEEGATRIEAAYNNSRTRRYKVVFQCDADSSSLPVYVNLLRRRGENRLTRLLGQLDLPVREVGITVTRADRQPDVFYRAEADSGDRAIREIGLVVPSSYQIISLRVTRGPDGARTAARHPSANFDDSGLRDERAFLLALEEEGLALPGSRPVIPPGSAEPEPAMVDSIPPVLDMPALFAEWLAANDSIASGTMRVRRVPGLPPPIGDVTDSVRIGNTIVTAHFRSGVLATDRRRGTSWALFHPHAAEAWPTVLLSVGRWLVIGTRGEGVACVDPVTLDLRRMPLAPPADKVVTIAARGDSIVINGLRPMALPTR